MYNKILSVLLSVMMILTIAHLTTFASTDTLLTLEELREKNGAITIEAYNIGQGFLIEPSLFTKDGRTTGGITVDILESQNLEYKGSTSYFGGMEFNDTAKAIYPEYLKPYLYDLYTEGDGDGYLSEFDYSSYAGWCYTINDWWASLGADSSCPGDTITDYNTGEDVVLGDVIRWHYTVYGYGADCGFSSNVMVEWMGGNLFTQEDKSDLIFILAAIKDYYGNLSTDDVYETALAVAANPLATALEIAEQITILTNYIEDTFLNTTPKFEITSCDTENVNFTFPEEGASITVILADYENKNLNQIKIIPVITQKTNSQNMMSIPLPSEITLSSDDKIMLWKNLTSCMPLCKAYVVTD